MKQNSFRPTDAELSILQVLWEKGPSTVRDVLDFLPGESRRGYTTILKLLQIMSVKGLVRRQTQNRAHIYEAAVGSEQTQRRLLSDLIERAFAGATGKLVMQALSESPASEEELGEIRRLLDEMERKRQ